MAELVARICCYFLGLAAIYYITESHVFEKMRDWFTELVNKIKIYITRK